MESAMFTPRDTELHTAIISGNLELIEKLIKSGANVNMPGLNGQTPLHYAAKKNAPEIIVLLLKNHADPEQTSNDGDKPIHIAAYNNSASALHALVEHDANQLTSTGRNSRTAFYVAAMQNNQDAMNALIKAGADINQIDAETGQSAMHYAVEKNEMKLLNYLLEKKANKEVLNIEGLTPLQYAASRLENASHLTAVKLVEAGANVNPPAGTPPLYLLADNSNEDSPHAAELAKLLHQHGAKLNDTYGDNPLEALGVTNTPQINR